MKTVYAWNGLGSEIGLSQYLNRTLKAVVAKELFTRQVLPWTRELTGWPGQGLILIGHSFGGATALRMAERIQKATPGAIQMVITLDPRNWLCDTRWATRFRSPDGVATINYYGKGRLFPGHQVDGAVNIELPSDVSHTQLVLHPDVIRRITEVING